MTERLTEEDLAYPSKETIRTGVGRAGWKYTDEAYHRRWLARLKARIAVNANSCWLWTGTLANNGYGQIGYRGKTRILHRKLFEVVHGVSLREDQFVCHTCDVKRCCNPAHLWLGNNGLNKKDETSKGKNFWANKTHCPRGHAYTADNTRVHEVRPGVWSRSCAACTRIRMRLKAGWTLEEAMTIGRVPSGYSRSRPA